MSTRCPLILVFRVFREMDPHGMPQNHRDVLAAIADHCAMQGDRITGWVSLPNIRKATGLGLTAIREARTELIEKRWLALTEGGGQSGEASHYEIFLDGERWTEVDRKTRHRLTPNARKAARLAEPSAGRHPTHPPDGTPPIRRAEVDSLAGRHPTHPPGGAKDHYKDPMLDHSQERLEDPPAPSSGARARGEERGPSLTATGQAILEALLAPYGDPPVEVLRPIATRDLAHQIAQFSLEDGHMGTKTTADLVLAIREVAGKERTAPPGEGRSGRELREFVFASARRIQRGAAAAAEKRAARGPGLASVTPISAAAHGRKHPAWVGRGGVGGHGQSL